MIAPGEIAPQHIEIQLRQHSARAQQRDRNEKTVADLLLIQLCDLRQNQARGAERRIAGGNGAGNHADNGQHAAHGAQHPRGDVINRAGLSQLGNGALQPAGSAVEGHAARGPDKGNHRFRKHGAVKHPASQPLGADALCHHGRLGGMEPGDRAAGHGDKHVRPDGQALWVKIPERDLRDGVAAREGAAQNAQRHDDQHRAEDRIQLADDLVNGQKRCQHIVNQDHHDPEGSAQRVRRQPGQQRGRRVDEHGSR